MEGTGVCGDILEQEAGFQQTIALLGLNTQEIEVEVQDSLEEVLKNYFKYFPHLSAKKFLLFGSTLLFLKVEDRKQFPCDFCSKVCKSKGGLTTHQTNKHPSEQGQSSRPLPESMQIVSSEKVEALISDIGQHLIDEKLYKKEHMAEVLKLKPSELSCQNSKGEKITTSCWNNFMARQLLTGKNILTSDQKIVFLMLIHLPERLVAFLEDSQDTSSAKV